MKNEFRNKFGKEYEIYLHSYKYLYKTHNLNAENLGNITPEQPMKSQSNQNSWRLVTAHDELLDFNDMAVVLLLSIKHFRTLILHQKQLFSNLNKN